MIEFTSKNHPNYGDMYIYVSMLERGQYVGGVAAGVGTTCAFDKGLRTAIVEYYKDDFTAADVRPGAGHFIFAHM